MNKLQIIFNRIKGLPKHYKRKYDNNALFREDWNTFRTLAPITTFFIMCFIIIIVLGIQRATTERNDMDEVGKENRMTFKIIDTLTGSLIITDIDQFFIGEDGHIIEH